MRPRARSHVIGLILVAVLLVSAPLMVEAHEDGRVDHVRVVTMSELRKEISSNPYVVATLYVWNCST